MLEEEIEAYASFALVRHHKHVHHASPHKRRTLVLLHSELVGCLRALRDSLIVELSELVQRLLHSCQLLAAD